MKFFLVDGNRSADSSADDDSDDDSDTGKAQDQSHDQVSLESSFLFHRKLELVEP